MGWARDIVAASDAKHQFIPFNQDGYLDLYSYGDAVQLDRLYQSKHPGLFRLYADFERLVATHNAQAVVVCDGPPFHPDYLLRLPLYRVLYSHDDPESTYQRNIPYLHAYHHVFYVTPAYTDDMDMAAKMRTCGMQNHDFVPNGALTFDYDSTRSEESLFESERDIDILFIGGFHWKKIDVLATLKKTFGSRFQWHGNARLKHNLYMTARYRRLFMVRPVTLARRRLLHQRAKIAVNVHNGYSVPNFGNQRLFYGPANGAMLLTDGIEHIEYLFKNGEEAVAYRDATDLIERCMHYLANPGERARIARAGYRRVMKEYKLADIVRRSADVIEQGMSNLGWTQGPHG
jgi:spore maturation protein CgeB